MALERAISGKCTTFICYRGDNGCDVAKYVYEWMLQHQNLNFGYVYFSDIRANANFINDINEYLSIAQNIIVIMNENFTNNFPQTIDEYNAQGCVGAKDIIVTAREVMAIMDRVRNGNKPNIFRLDDGQHIEPPPEPFVRLASHFSESERESEETKNLANIFLTQAKAVLPRRGSAISQFNNILEGALSSIGIPISVGVREKAIIHYQDKLGHLSDFEFDVCEQMIDEIEVIKDENGKKVEAIRCSYTMDTLIDYLMQSKQCRVASVTGNSGMGKTTQLLKLCNERNKKRIKPDGSIDIKSPPFFFFPANRLNAYKYDEEIFYSTFMSLYGISLHDKQRSFKNTVLTQIFDNPFQSNDAPCVVLIDALDEVKSDDKLNAITSAIRDLAQQGIAVVVTSRQDKPLSGMVELQHMATKIRALQDAWKTLPENHRPQEGSPLAKLLTIPFYYSLYKESIELEYRNGTISMGDVFIYTAPILPGELMWNYLARHLCKRRGENGFRTRDELYDEFFLLVILPQLADKMESTNDDVRVIYDRICQSFDEWIPFWSTNCGLRFSNHTFKRIGNSELPLFDDFEMFYQRVFPLFGVSDEGYRFKHSLFAEFFKALNVVNGLSLLARYAGSGTDLTNRSPEILQLQNQSLSFETIKFAGQLCGECRNIPEFDPSAGKWVSHNSPEHCVIHRAMNSLRQNSGQAKQLSTPILINNIYRILKTARTRNDALPDMSNVDFSGIDMTLCSLPNVIFSHIDPFDQTNKMCADFRGAKFDYTVSFLCGHQGTNSNTSIGAMSGVGKGRLLSVDNAGIAVLWDTDLVLPLDKIKLFDSHRKVILSNILKVGKNQYCIAGNNVLAFIRVVGEKQNKIELSYFKELSTHATNQIGMNQKTGEIYYYPAISPLDRYNLDGSVYYDSSIDGRWIPNTVVNKSGDRAFSISYMVSSGVNCDGNCVSCREKYRYKNRWIPKCVPPDDYHALDSDNSNSMNNYRMNISTVAEIVVWERDAEKGWICSDIPLISCNQLKKYTGYDNFRNGNLYLEESPKKHWLILSLKCHADRDESNLILTYDLDKNEFVRKDILPVKNIWKFGCSVGKDYFSSSYLTIRRSNWGLKDSMVFSTGSRMPSEVLFMPDTKSFVAVCSNSNSIQICSCDRLPLWKCISDISNLNFSKASTHSALAFLFDNATVFEHPNFMEYPGHLFLIKYKSAVHLQTGQLSKSVDGLYAFDAPKVAFFGKNTERFRLEIKNGCVVAEPLSASDFKRVRLNVHLEWHFAGCDFSNADFTNGMSDELYPYGLFDTAEICQSCADDDFEHDEDEDYFNLDEEEF